MTTKLPGMYAEVEEYVPPDSDAPYFSGILTLVDGKGYFVYHRLQRIAYWL